MYQEAGNLGGGGSQEASHTPAVRMPHGQTVQGAFKTPGRGSPTILLERKRKKNQCNSVKWGLRGGLRGSAREASSCLKTGIKRTPPTLATFAKHPHLAGRTMPGQQSGLEETVGGKLRPEDSDLRPQGGRVRARVPTPTRRPGTPLAARASSSAKLSRGRPDTRLGAGGPGDTGREGTLRAVRAPRRRWGPRLVPEPRLEAGGARGAGARRRAHSTPAATPCTKWALSGPPFRSPPGSSSGAPPPPERRRARRRGGG